MIRLYWQPSVGRGLSVGPWGLLYTLPLLLREGPQHLYREIGSRGQMPKMKRLPWPWLDWRQERQRRSARLHGERHRSRATIYILESQIREVSNVWQKQYSRRISGYFWKPFPLVSLWTPLIPPIIPLYSIRRLDWSQLTRVFDASGLRLTAGTRSGENPSKGPENGTFFEVGACNPYSSILPVTDVHGPRLVLFVYIG